MTDILIESLYSTGGTMPESGIDTTSLYSGWSVSDEAQLGLAATDTLTIPGNYIVGEDLVLVVSEQTPGASKKHQWQASVTLNGGTPEVFTAEYTSSATANTETTRLFTISTSGEIDSVAIAGGDELEIVLSRIAASGTEDPNDIKVHSFNLRVAVEPVSIVFSGRVKAICDEVGILANDNTDYPFASSTKVLGWINDCTLKIAETGYFKKTTTIDLTANVDPVDLLDDTVVPDLYKVINIKWAATGRVLPTLATMELVDRGRIYYAGGEVVLGYHIAQNQLYTVPVLTSSVTGALDIYHSYYPAAMDGTPGSCTPLTPLSFDKSVYVPYCRAQLALMDKRIDDYALYNAIFEKGMGRLSVQGTTTGFSMRPYRG